MIQGTYTSFEEIDRDLKILKLQRQIEEEKVKLAVQNTKNELYPTNILGGLAPLLQKVAISLVAKKILKLVKCQAFAKYEYDAEECEHHPDNFSGADVIARNKKVGK